MDDKTADAPSEIWIDTESEDYFVWDKDYAPDHAIRYVRADFYEALLIIWEASWEALADAEKETQDDS